MLFCTKLRQTQLKDAISESIPTSCNNQHPLQLSYLVRMIEIVRKSSNELLRFLAVRKNSEKTRNIIL